LARIGTPARRGMWQVVACGQSFAAGSGQGGIVVAGASGEATMVVKVTYQGSPSEGR